MATGARLQTGFDTVAEYTIKTETRGAMAQAAIDSHVRMAWRLPCRVDAIVTAGTVVCNVAVIRVGAPEIVGCVTGTAVGVGN